MRVLNEKLREKILDESLNLFYEVGYKDTTMRLIASKSGITVGNVYRYFKNKESLFTIIMDPIKNKIISFMKNLYEGDYESFYTCLNDEVTLFFMELYTTYYKEVYTLIFNTKDSPLENTLKEITDLLSNYLLKESKESSSLDTLDIFMANLISKTFIEGLILIFKEFNENKERLDYTVKLHKFCFKSCLKN